MLRKTIKLLPSEDHTLRELHRASRIPVDQWAQRPRFAARFVENWNGVTGRHDTLDEVRHYIISKRKQAKWFKFGDDFDKLRSPGEEDFTPSEWEALRAAYLEMNVGRDQYAADGDLRDKLADLFRANSGRYVSGERLYAAIMAQQKHKQNGWPPVGPNPPAGRGFGDIDQVA